MEQLYNVAKNNNQDVIQGLKSKNGQHQTFMFKDTDFQNKTINGLQLNEGQFYSCDFTVSKIGGCKFNNCQFIKCKFNSVDLLGVQFKNCTIDNCDFTNANMNDVYFIDNIITNNIFKQVNLISNVTVNGEDIIDCDQLNLVIGDTKNNIIVDDTNDKNTQINIEQVLKQFKCFNNDGNQGFSLSEGNITLVIAQDEGGWRMMFGYNKDGQFDDSIVSEIIDFDQDSLPEKQEIVKNIKDSAALIGDMCKSKVKTDFIKQNIDKIVDTIKNCNVTVTESVFQPTQTCDPNLTENLETIKLLIKNLADRVDTLQKKVR